MKITEANKAKLVQPTGFGAYDVCINPYVGCQFGCKYCYVRFFVKDKEKGWGDFVRKRSFLEGKLRDEVSKIDGQRLVIGTMTDPYQPVERKAGLTRKTLEIIRDTAVFPRSIGIFTRSPTVRRDIKLLQQLKARVHFTITPFEREVMRKIEPIPIKTEARFKVVKELTEAGISVHVSVSPVLPVLSDGLRKDFADRIAEAKPSGFTVDPMQCYGPAFQATDEALGEDPQWAECREIVRDKKRYKIWKQANRAAWEAAWRPHAGLGLLAIIMNHQAKKRYDLVTGEEIDFQEFGYK